MKKLIKNNLYIVLLILIIGFGSFLRVYKLTSIPAGFFADEASIGHNGLSILSTGKDEFNVSFPLYFRSFDDYKPGISIYSTIPFIYFLGLNELSIRLPFALYGILLIVIMYGVGKNLFSRKLGLISAALTAICPWLIHYSRIGFEVITFPIFSVLSLLFLLKSKNKPIYLLIFFIFLSLTFYTYRASFIVTPLFFVALFLIYNNLFFKNLKFTLIGITLFIIISIPLVVSFINKTGLQRAQQVSILTQNLPFTEKLRTILDNYLYQLTPTFLFIKGDTTPVTRHFTDGFTPLYLIMAPFLLIGIIWIIKNRNKTFSKLAIAWILIYPITGALAGAPFTSRSIIGAPIFILLTALGIIFSFEHVQQKLKLGFAMVTAFLFFITVSLFYKFYFFEYPLYSSDFWGWQYGAKDIVSYFVSQKDKYDQTIISSEFNAPYIFLKFYAPNDCDKCIVGLPHELYTPQIKQLFAITPTYLNTHPEYVIIEKEKIIYPNGSVAFIIGEVVK